MRLSFCGIGQYAPTLGQPLADFLGIPAFACHDSILLRNGASGNPGAAQTPRFEWRGGGRIEESVAMGEVRLALRPYGRKNKLRFGSVR